MPDWTKSMKQTFAYYEVDPITWKDKSELRNVTSCNMTRDSEEETLGSSSLESLDDVSDKYIRTYLITEQSGIKERIPLGTYIYETPSTRYDGRSRQVSQDGYTPLVELKETPPQFGFALMKDTPILSTAATLAEAHMRAPVVRGEDDKILTENFVSSEDDNWLFFVSDLVANAGYGLGLDEMGRLIFEKKRDTEVLSPVWIYTDDNSSILYPEIETSRDLYGVPNVVEVIYSRSDKPPLFARAENNDTNSIVSRASRGRDIVHRDTNPSIASDMTATDDNIQVLLNEYANNLLKELSALEYRVTYTHGYCPVRIGDAVLLNYRSAGLDYVKAKVTRQIIKCQSGCSVQETAVFTKKLWG